MSKENLLKAFRGALDEMEGASHQHYSRGADTYVLSKQAHEEVRAALRAALELVTHLSETELAKAYAMEKERMRAHQQQRAFEEILRSASAFTGRGFNASFEDILRSVGMDPEAARPFRPFIYGFDQASERDNTAYHTADPTSSEPLQPDFSSKDWWRVLGVTASADEKRIKRAYRRLAQKHHPDKDKTHGAVERFQRIQAAYRTGLEGL